VHETDATRLERAFPQRTAAVLVERAGGRPADVAAARAVATLKLAPRRPNELVGSTAAQALDGLYRHGPSIGGNIRPTDSLERGTAL
jgi:hypothetical protein